MIIIEKRIKDMEERNNSIGAHIRQTEIPRKEEIAQGQTDLHY